MTPVALVGCGHCHTPAFIKMLKGRGDVAVRRVWDHDPARARRAADELGASVVPDAEAAWADDAVKAVLVCSETDRHAALVKPAAAAGKHLFVEKPLGFAAADAAEMADAVARGDLAGALETYRRVAPVVDVVMHRAQGAMTAKAAMQLLGVLDNRAVRLPLVPASEELVAELRSAMSTLGVLDATKGIL